MSETSNVSDEQALVMNRSEINNFELCPNNCCTSLSLR